MTSALHMLGGIKRCSLHIASSFGDCRQNILCRPAEHSPVPLEYERILDEDDFARIRELRHEKMVKELMGKHGLKSTAKRERLLAAAQDEADEALDKRVRSHAFLVHQAFVLPNVVKLSASLDTAICYHHNMSKTAKTKTRTNSQLGKVKSRAKL